MPVNAENIFKEGVYRVTDYNFLPKNLYTVQNISTDSDVYVIILSDDQVEMQYIRLKPSSEKSNLIHLESNYKIVILGDGEAFIN
jgi:hypothetical protein